MEEQAKYLPVVEQPKITQKEIDDFLFASGTKLTGPQKAMFYQVAHLNNLNPFKREIYAIPYGDRFNIITGYEVYLKRAERTGKLDGWEADYVTDQGGDYAYCTVYRKDWAKPLTQKVWLGEFAQDNRMWREKRRTMLIKVAIATAFRRAFPEEMGGLPYTSDEIPLEGEVIKPLPLPEEKPKQPQPQPQPFDEFFDSQDEQGRKLINDFIETFINSGVTREVLISRANKNLDKFKELFDAWVNA